MLLFVPVPWLIGWVLAAILHELGHLLALYIFRIKIYSLQLSVLGAKIVTEAISPFQEAICAFSGPAIGLLSLVFMKSFPYAALAAVIQSTYNLIPIYPLDGGRVMLALLNCFLPSRIAVKISNFVSYAVILAITILGAWVSYRYRLGFWSIWYPFAAIILIMRKNTLH